MTPHSGGVYYRFQMKGDSLENEHLDPIVLAGQQFGAAPRSDG